MTRTMLVLGGVLIIIVVAGIAYEAFPHQSAEVPGSAQAIVPAGAPEVSAPSPATTKTPVVSPVQPIQKKVPVAPKAPVIVATPESGTEPLSVSFTTAPVTMAGVPGTLVFDFGDGKSITLCDFGTSCSKKIFGDRYPTPGVYSATLINTDLHKDRPDIIIASTTITVLRNENCPVADVPVCGYIPCKPPPSSCTTDASGHQTCTAGECLPAVEQFRNECIAHSVGATILEGQKCS